MGPHVHRTSIRIASCHRPLRWQRLNLSDRPPGTQDLLANLTQLHVRSHAQSPSRPANGVEIGGGGGCGFDDHQVVVSADIEDCDPRIRRGCSALECEPRSEQPRVVRHEPVEVGRGQSQMVDSEEIGHGSPTVVQPLDGTWVMLEMWSQRPTYQGELDGSFVADGKSVVPRGDATGLLEQGESALDFVPSFVHFAVERRRTAAGRTTPEAVSCLVTLLRDGVRNLTFAQVGADGAGGVSAVGKHVVGPGPWAPTADPGDADSVHHLLEGGCVASLSDSYDSGEDMEGCVDGEVNLGGQPAARASEAVVVRLGRQAVLARPVRIVSPFLRAPAAC